MYKQREREKSLNESARPNQSALCCQAVSISYNCQHLQRLDTLLSRFVAQDGKCACVHARVRVLCAQIID